MPSEEVFGGFDDGEPSKSGVALYAYTADDEEEVSFEKGDKLTNIVDVEEGWVSATVVRTGDSGTLPANYVKISKAPKPPPPPAKKKSGKKKSKAGDVDDLSKEELMAMLQKEREPTSVTMPSFTKGDVGKRVTVEGYEGKGKIAFVGRHAVDGKPRIGAEMDNPVGKNNGTVKGHTYFKCENKHGVLAVPSKVSFAKKSVPAAKKSTAEKDKKKRAKTTAKTCIQTTSSGPCENEAVSGQERCTVHTCEHPDCETAKSSKVKYCKKHANYKALKAAPPPAPPAITFQKGHIGKRVTVEGYSGKGTIQFIGKHAQQGSPRVGVEMDGAVGKNNGTVKGHEYFKCSANHGVLVTPEKVSFVRQASSKETTSTKAGDSAPAATIDGHMDVSDDVNGSIEHKEDVNTNQAALDEEDGAPAARSEEKVDANQAALDAEMAELLGELGGGAPAARSEEKVDANQAALNAEMAELLGELGGGAPAATTEEEDQFDGFQDDGAVQQDATEEATQEASPAAEKANEGNVTTADSTTTAGTAAAPRASHVAEDQENATDGPAIEGAVAAGKGGDPNPTCQVCNESKPATWACPEEGCEDYFCDECNDDEHRSKKTKGHVRTPVTTAEASPVPNDPEPELGSAQAVALYAYTATDDEEISFEKGDTFVDVEDAEIEGWLKGTVVRTGATGLMPANYVTIQNAEAPNLDGSGEEQVGGSASDDDGSVGQGGGGDPQPEESPEKTAKNILQKAAKKGPKKKKKKMSTAAKTCIQATSSGPCENDAVVGQDRCAVHTCQHPDCEAAKSSRAKFCTKHAAPAEETGGDVIDAQPKALQTGNGEEGSTETEVIAAASKPALAGSFCGELTTGGNIKVFSAPIEEQPTVEQSNQQTEAPEEAEVRPFKFKDLFDNLISRFKKKVKKMEVKKKEGLPKAMLETMLEDERRKAVKTDSSISPGNPAEICTNETNGHQCGINQTSTRGKYCRIHSCPCGKEKKADDLECPVCVKGEHWSLLIKVISTVPQDQKITLEQFRARVEKMSSKTPKVSKEMGVDITDPVEYHPIEEQVTRIKELVKRKTKEVLEDDERTPKSKAVTYFLEDGKKDKKMVADAVDWLINAFDVTPHQVVKHVHTDKCKPPNTCNLKDEHPAKELMKKLLAKENFTRELESNDSSHRHVHNRDCIKACRKDHDHTDECKKECKITKKSEFDRLKDGAREVSDRVGKARLEPLFEKFGLGQHFSKIVVEDLITWHTDRPMEHKEHTKGCEKECKIAITIDDEDEYKKDSSKVFMKVRQTWAIPELYKLMHEKLDFQRDPFPQRVAAVAHLMYSQLLNNSFNDKMQELANAIEGCTFGDPGPAPPKGYARTFNKLFSEDDYLNLPSKGGRAAWIVDSLRCLFAGRDVKCVQEIVKKLVSEMGGLLGLKNPFTMDAKKRAQRSHLLLVNVGILFDSKKTVGDLVKGNRARKIFADFKKKRDHREPTERWEQLCDDAVKILKDPALELVPARIACEVQIVFESHKQARHDIHDAYDVSRANKDVQLYNQFASSALTDDQRADATDFLTACLRGQNSVVEKFIAAEKRKSTSGDQKLAAKSMINTECQKGTSEGLEKGKTATYYAVKNNHPDILKLLLDNGADLTPEDQELAFKDGYVEITTMFNLSAEDATKQLPQAVRKNRQEQVKDFLSKGADPNSTDKEGETVLCLAVKGDNVEMVRILLQNQLKDRPKSSAQPGKDSGPGNGGGNDNAGAALPKRKQSVEIKTAQVDLPNSNGETPFAIALKQKNAAGLITILVEEGRADVRQKLNKGKKALNVAVGKGDAALVQVLLDFGLDVNTASKKGTPLLIAAMGNDAKIMDILLKHKADANASNDQGTALDIAVNMLPDSGNEKLVDLLIKSQVDINVAGKHGYPITVATLAKNTKLMQVLIKAGAKVDVGGPDGQSLLMYACNTSKKGDVELFSILAKGKGADLDEVDKDGNTLLCNAAIAGNLQMLDILIRQGAKVNLQSRNGKTALDFAKEKASEGSEVHLACVDHLYAKGAHEGGCTRCMRCCTNPRFKHGPFSCCDSGCAVCLIDGCVCTPHSFATLHSAYDGCGGYLGGCLCLCTPFIGPYFLRKTVEAGSGIKESDGVSCCFSFWCNWCSLMQVYQEGAAQGKVKPCCDGDCDLDCDLDCDGCDTDFDYGMFACCESGFTMCLIDGCCCLPCSFAKLHEEHDGCGGYWGGCGYWACIPLYCCWYCPIPLPVIGLYLLRKKTESGKKENFAATFCYSWCCFVCSFMQIYQGSVLEGKVEPSCGGGSSSGKGSQAKNTSKELAHKDVSGDRAGCINCLIYSWCGKDYWCNEDSNMCCRAGCRDVAGLLFCCEDSGDDPDGPIAQAYMTHCCCCGSTCGCLASSLMALTCASGGCAGLIFVMCCCAPCFMDSDGAWCCTTCDLCES